MKKYIISIIILFSIPAITGGILCATPDQKADAAPGTAAIYGSKIGMWSVDPITHHTASSPETMPVINPANMFSQLP